MLHERLPCELPVLALQDDAKAIHHLLILRILLHDGLDQLANGRHDVLAEAPLQRLRTILWLLLVGPNFALGMEEPVTPELVHHPRLLYTRLGCQKPREVLQGEAPAMQTAAECHVPGLRAHLQVAHGGVVVGGNDDVHILYSIPEAQVHVLRFHLHLQDAAINLVHKEARLDPLLQGLP